MAEFSLLSIFPKERSSSSLSLLILLFSFLLTSSGLSQSRPHKNAHSHNDYAQADPLLGALANLFTSLEADVHLVKGKLLVSHNRPDPSAKTLEAQYLKPLDSIANMNGGLIYPGYQAPITLLVDIKTGAEDTFAALTKLLSTYETLLNTPSHPGAVQVVISGNRPINMIRENPKHLAAIDGRPEDLGNGFTTSEMPLISENYNKVIHWNGEGSPSESALNRLKELAKSTHEEGKRLRLWAIPDHRHAWEILLESGVDLINTDRLEELNIFLSSTHR